MLTATQDEIDKIKAYVESHDSKLKVTFAQKMHVENILGHLHEVWDIHCKRKRFWLITNPTFIYDQTMFPNMDLMVTFHVGLCLRMPRSERQPLSDLPVEPFAECVRLAREANDALRQAQEVSDYQTIGVRCREAMLALVGAAQVVMPWTAAEEQPKKGDLKAWADHMCNVALGGRAHKDRRKHMKTLLTSTWDFDCWLTHAKSSSWHDAEIACSTTELAISLWTSIIIRHIRKVPESCPACGSRRLSPQRARPPEAPETQYERPICEKCGWTGEPTLITEVPEAPVEPRGAPEGDCVIPTMPLRTLRKPIKADRLSRVPEK